MNGLQSRVIRHEHACRGRAVKDLLRHGHHMPLTLLDKPLFPQCIEAWIHGPVMPALYRAYKSYRAEAIPSPQALDFSKYDQETQDLLDEVYAVYGQFAAWKLRNMTHQEPPGARPLKGRKSRTTRCGPTLKPRSTCEP